MNRQMNCCIKDLVKSKNTGSVLVAHQAAGYYFPVEKSIQGLIIN